MDDVSLTALKILGQYMHADFRSLFALCRGACSSMARRHRRPPVALESCRERCAHQGLLPTTEPRFQNGPGHALWVSKGEFRDHPVSAAGPWRQQRLYLHPTRIRCSETAPHADGSGRDIRMSGRDKFDWYTRH